MQSKRKYNANQTSQDVVRSYKRSNVGPTLRRRKPTGAPYLRKYQPVANLERKFFDQVLSFSPGYDTTTCQLINPIPAGTGQSAMSGTDCALLTLELRYHIDINVTSKGNTVPLPIQQSIRCMVIYDNDPQSSVPLQSDILSTGSTASAILSPLNINNSDRFLVLYNQVHDMGTGQNFTAGGVLVGPLTATAYKHISMKLPYKGPSTAGITGIKKGAMYFIAVSNQLATNTAATVTAYCRTRYTDA